MSEIPSEIASSAAQSGFQAREAARDQEARRPAAADPPGRNVKAAEEAEAAVETSDQDVAVFSDAEGAGSQGRSEGSGEEEGAVDAPGSAAGITRDEEGNPHIDVQA